MTQLFYSLALLACPVGMGVMMWFMMRGGNKQDTATPPAPAQRDELARLQTEIDQLRAAQAVPRPEQTAPTARP